jgi:hypothetical protein
MCVVQRVCSVKINCAWKRKCVVKSHPHGRPSWSEKREKKKLVVKSHPHGTRPRGLQPPNPSNVCSNDENLSGKESPSWQHRRILSADRPKVSNRPNRRTHTKQRPLSASASARGQPVFLVCRLWLRFRKVSWARNASRISPLLKILFSQHRNVWVSPARLSLAYSLSRSLARSHTHTHMCVCVYVKKTALKRKAMRLQRISAHGWPSSQHRNRS